MTVELVFCIAELRWTSECLCNEICRHVDCLIVNFEPCLSSSISFLSCLAV